MDISVILATYRRPELLVNTLESFCKMNTGALNWEAIVVDNANDAKTKDLIQQFSSILPLTFLVESKRGKNHALNLALHYAKGELLVFTDDDIIADVEWLSEVCNGAKRWPHNFVFGGRILPRFPKNAHLNSLELTKNPFLRLAYGIADWEMPEGLYPAGKVWGANMALKSSIICQGYVFNVAIGPDGSHHYTMGSETELLLRLEQDGYRPVYLPNSLVYHQIRKEQLKTSWLYKRAFRSARGSVFNSTIPDVPFLFGIPRYLWKVLLVKTGRFVLKMYNKDKRLDAGIELWSALGMIHQYLKSLSISRTPAK
jgi:glucosyl-dolichyl phosphate glucuronosyltransferase